MKNAVIVACMVLLAIQSTLIDAGKRKKDGTPMRPEQVQAIERVLAKPGYEKCAKLIKKYGKSKDPVEENCDKIERFEKIMQRNGCDEEVRQQMRNILGCDQSGTDGKSQAQKDETIVTPATNVTAGVTTVTTTKGSQTGSNGTKPKA